MILPYRIVRHEADERGRKYIDIFIMRDNNDLAIMTVYLESDIRKARGSKRKDKITICYVEKYNKKLKGCFREFIKILVFQTSEIFGRELYNSTKVLLFIPDNQPPGGIDFNESFSRNQLKRLCNAIGCRNYDPTNPLFMIVTISKLKYVLGEKTL